MARLLAVLGILAVSLAAYLLLRDPPTPAPGGQPPANQAPPEPGSKGPVPIEAAGPATPPAAKAPEPAPAAAKATEHPDWVAFPDGSALPPLNGVAKAPKLTWHRLLPYTKVVGKERDAQGRDWYVHENGARSTTYIDALGKAIAELAMPAATKPILEDR